MDAETTVWVAVALAVGGCTREVAVGPTAPVETQAVAELAARKEVLEFRRAKLVAESAHELGKTRRAGDLDVMSRLTALAEFQETMGSLDNSQKLEVQRLVERLTDRYGEIGVSVDADSGDLQVRGGAAESLLEVMRAEASEELAAIIAAIEAERDGIERLSVLLAK